MAAAPELCVIMPVYNESAVIASVLRSWVEELRVLGMDFAIHAYDDGSRDDSLARMRDVAEEHTEIVVHTHANRGHGPTILKGYRENDGAEWLFQTDSDGEMHAAHFAALWSRREDYDFLSGSRKGRDSTLIRRCISLGARTLIWTLYKPGPKDVNSPFRLMRAAHFRDLFRIIPDDTFAPNVIISGVAPLQGSRVFETPVPFKQRMARAEQPAGWSMLAKTPKSLAQAARFRFSRELQTLLRNRSPR